MMKSETKELRNIWVYVTCAAALTVLGIGLQPVAWRGTAELHTLMELTATLLALIVGVKSIIRFYSKKQSTYLFVGIGFLGTAFLDGYHAIVTSSFFSQHLPSGLLTLIPWSWNASRTFLAILMVLSLWAWKREQRLGVVGRLPERVVYLMVGLLTLASLLFFTVVPLPRAYYPELFFGRPEEFVAGALFLVALIGYLKKLAWKHDPFENWLVFSLILGFVCQVVVMSRSFALFDSMFDLAHTLKILSYLCVLTGLFINTFHLFIEAQRSREILAESNASLQQEVELRKQAEQRQAALNQEIESQSQQIAAANTSLKQSNDELKQFAYVASHDLQEPLRKVNSFCQLLSDEYADQLDDDAKSYIRYAVDGASRMRNLVADLLDYSRVETQGKPLAPTDAGDACSEAIDILQAAIEDSDAKINVQQLPTIQADRAQLIRLFQNLIGNAIKYSGDSPPEIHISTQEQDHDWVLSIRDNGIGMEPQYYERIFVMFQRLHARDEYTGTGIGLAICKRIVDRLQGRIWVESEPGTGSTFFLSIPKLTNMPVEGATGYESSHPVYAETH